MMIRIRSGSATPPTYSDSKHIGYHSPPPTPRAPRPHLGAALPAQQVLEQRARIQLGAWGVQRAHGGDGAPDQIGHGGGGCRLPPRAAAAGAGGLKRGVVLLAEVEGSAMGAISPPRPAAPIILRALQHQHRHRQGVQRAPHIGCFSAGLGASGIAPPPPPPVAMNPYPQQQQYGQGYAAQQQAGGATSAQQVVR